MTEMESKVVEAGRQASLDLGIRFIAPFTAKPARKDSRT